MLKHFQQSDFWCDFKCAHGWSKIKYNNINILLRSFKKGPLSFSIAYVPMAPEFSQKAEDEESYFVNLKTICSELKNTLPNNTLCIRFDIPFDFDDVESKNNFLARFYKYSKQLNFNIKKNDVDIQPPDSTFVDLTKDCDTLLKEMKSKGRYNVNYAKKHGITVRAVNADDENFEKDLHSFYNLYKTTAARDGIGIHPESYYEDLLKRGSAIIKGDNTDSTKITLYIASHENEDLAAIITLFQEDEAIYLYGCSSNNKRNLMPTYLIQWTAICDAKDYGSKIYDFYGIPPTAAEGHPMHGLYLFKTNFGGKEVHRPGSFDVPLNGLYNFYTFAEKLRAFWHKTILKKIRGR